MSTLRPDSPPAKFKPLVSVVVPAYNEQDILSKNLSEICAYMSQLERQYRWELIVVNDGSSDATGRLADEFARRFRNISVFHHAANRRLGVALRTGFSKCRGDFIVVMDLDLSYSPEHISPMLEKMRETGAEVVIASPFRKGGRISNVPWKRRIFTHWANRFLSYMATGRLFSKRITNITGMVRAYDGEFIRNISLRAVDVEINPEIIFKAAILRVRIDEIPAHLSWRPVRTETGALVRRKSSARIRRSIAHSILSGFILRPVKFFTVPGFALLAISMYPNAWALAHIVREYARQAGSGLGFDARVSVAVATAFKLFPHTFIVGGISLLVAIQLISLGFLAFQNKRYFEDLYNLTEDISRKTAPKPDTGSFPGDADS